jgi:UDP-3-O-[3-hydroxymyristoyl] glucosamine N-acyltransferase
LGAPALEDKASRRSEFVRMSEAFLTRAQVAALAGVAMEAIRGGEVDRVTRVCAAASAGLFDLVFAEDESSLAAALASGAGVILAAETLPRCEDPRVLWCADARYSFAVCARELARQQQASGSDAALIHPSAQVAATARLGARVRVGACAVVEAGAVVGDDSSLGANVVVAEGVILGARVVVQAGAILGSRGFGYVRHRVTGEYLLFPQVGALVIEDDVEIGANTTIDRGALEETRIGRGTKIDNLVHIGHNCRIGQNVVIAAQVGISGSCVVEDGAVLAGQVGISDHCHIGPGVILGGQAGVYRGKSVSGPGEVFAGTPAEPVREQMRALAQLRAMARVRKGR